MRGLTLWQAVAISTQFGFILAVSVFVGFGLGWLVDSWTPVGPIAYLLGALLGLVSGVYSIVRLVQTFLKRDDAATGAPPPARKRPRAETAREQADRGHG